MNPICGPYPASGLRVRRSTCASECENQARKKSERRRSFRSPAETTRPFADKRAPSRAEPQFHGPDATSTSRLIPHVVHSSCPRRTSAESRAIVPRSPGTKRRAFLQFTAVEKKQDVRRRPRLRQRQQRRRPGAPQGHRCRAEHGVQARDPVHGQLRGQAGTRTRASRSTTVRSPIVASAFEGLLRPPSREDASVAARGDRNARGRSGLPTKRARVARRRSGERGAPRAAVGPPRPRPRARLPRPSPTPLTRGDAACVASKLFFSAIRKRAPSSRPPRVHA